MDQLEYLEIERKKLWQRLVEFQAQLTALEEQIRKKTPDYEQEARSASKKVSEFRNKCESAKDEAKALVRDIQSISDSIKQSNVTEAINEIKTAHESIIPRAQAVSKQIEQLEQLFSSYAAYAENLNKLNGLYESAQSTSSKLDATANHLLSRRNEIDKVYVEIFGYSEKNEQTGQAEVIPGRKHDLEKAYDDLKSGIEKFSRETTDEFAKKYKEWEGKLTAVHDRIQSLMPQALTAGLSAAYSSKKEDEIVDHGRLEGRFSTAVAGLVMISSIPIFVGIHSLVGGKTTADVIVEMRGLLPIVLPLYVPVLWLAYSFNKKMNLSKRLIEEYTHKEVLSKTYEGLSRQIADIADGPMSSDLKTRLLYNMLEISSENPGKLISNYDKSDHPLMDALDRSVKLSNSIEYLAKVPGMSKLVNILEKRAEELIDKETKKITDAIDTVHPPKVPEPEAAGGQK